MELKEWREYKKRNKIQNQPKAQRCFYFLSDEKFYHNDFCLSETKFEIYLFKKPKSEILELPKEIHDYYISNPTEIKKTLISYFNYNYIFLNFHNDLIKIKIFSIIENKFIIDEIIELKDLGPIKTKIRNSLKELSKDLTKCVSFEEEINKYKMKIKRLKLEKAIEQRSETNRITDSFEL